MKSIKVAIAKETIEGKSIYSLDIDGKAHGSITNRNKVVSLIEEAMRREFK